MLNLTNKAVVKKYFFLSLLLAGTFSLAAPVSAQIGISTQTVSSGELIRASDWNKVKLDLETLAAAIGSLQNQTWESSGADTYYDAGNVGIGVNSPTGSLHVYADAPAPNAVLLQLGTSDDADRVRIDEDGDMNIDGKLVVRDSDIYESGGDLELSGEDSLYLSMDWNNNDGDTQNIYFGKNSDGAGANFVELMRLTESGDLSIGVANPASKVHLSGAIQIGGDPSPCEATKAGAMRYDSGAVERCDGANWDALATTNVSDNLGSHVAEQNLNLDTFRLVGEGGTEGIGIDVDGSVGVGTDNPTTRLDVTDDQATVLTVRTTAVDNENSALVVTGAQTTSTTADIASIQLNNKDNSPFEGARIALKNGDASNGTALGDLVFYTNTGSADNLTEKMRILDTGAVGIGTSAPVAQLQVLKDTPAANEIVFQVGTNNDVNRFSVDEDGDFFSDGNAYIDGGNVLANNGSITVAGEDSLYLAADWNNNDVENRSIIFGKNGVGGGAGFAELARINENGRFGLNENNPAHLLHVGDSITNDRVAVIENLATTGSPEGLLVLTGQGAGPGANFAVGTGVASSHTKKFVVTNEGRVGVGTSNPETFLEVAGDIAIAGLGSLIGTGSSDFFLGNDQHVRIDEDAGVVFNDQGRGAYDFRIESDTVEGAFFVDATNGNVGIGTTSPSEKLQVNGNLRVQPDSGGAFLQLWGANTGTDGAFNVRTNGGEFSVIDAVASQERISIDGSGELEINSISSDGTGKVVCVKSDGNLGTCTDAPDGTGACSCS